VAADLVNVGGDGPVRTLTLDSPHNRNALSSRLLSELSEGLRNATSDEAIRVVVLSGTGTVFSSGADLSERSEFRPQKMLGVISAIRNSRVPVIARVNGHARAGGIGLVAASDLAAAPSAATFAFSEVRVGVAPAIILVPSLEVATRRFLARTSLTGDPFSAAEAAEAGLLTAVVDDEAALDAWVEQQVSSILASAPGAVAATKALLAELPETGFDEGLAAAAARSAELFAGVEAAEGTDAFLHKRTPSWRVERS
jgi:enoyl-CoA hydratase/carnithine racemase